MNQKLSRRDLGAVALGSGLAVAGAPANAQSAPSSISKEQYFGNAALPLILQGEAGFSLRTTSIDAPATLKTLIKYLLSQKFISVKEASDLNKLVEIIANSTNFAVVIQAIREAYDKITKDASEAFRAIVSTLKGVVEQIAKDYESLSPEKKRRVTLKAYAGVLSAIAMLVKSFGVPGIAVAAVLGAAVAFLMALSDEIPR